MTRFLLAGLLVPLAAAAAAAEGAASVRIARVWGEEVRLQVRGSTAAVDAAVGDSLETGDEVRVGEASGADVLLSSAGVVSLRENTVFRLGEAKAGSSLFLDKGAMLLRWKSTQGRTALNVRTPNAVAAVRGTEFAVETEGGDAPTVVGVFDEGRVEASNDAGAVELGPGKETTCAPGSAPEAPRPLRAMLKYRESMRALRGRLATLQRDLRRLPAEKRRELRRGKPEER